jgi:hypothetical protein
MKTTVRFSFVIALLSFAGCGSSTTGNSGGNGTTTTDCGPPTSYLNVYTCDRRDPNPPDELRLCDEAYYSTTAHEPAMEKFEADCIYEGYDFMTTECPETTDLMLICSTAEEGAIPVGRFFFYESGAATIDELTVSHMEDGDMDCCPGPAYPL